MTAPQPPQPSAPKPILDEQTGKWWMHPHTPQAAWWDDVSQTWVPYQAAPSVGQPPVKQKKRVFLWVFLAIQVLFIIWIIGGVSSSAGDATDCGSLDQETCNAAEDVGTSIGVGILIAFWAVVDIILGVGYGIYRLAKRP